MRPKDFEEKKREAFVTVTARQDEGPLQYPSAESKDDKEVVLAVVKTNGDALQYASDRLKNDRDVVLAAVMQNWRALEYASRALKDNRDVVLAAVETNGYALYSASDALKKDSKFILAAVKTNGLALEYASDALKNDKAFMLAAVEQCGVALEYASGELKQDQALISMACKSAHDANKRPDIRGEVTIKSFEKRFGISVVRIYNARRSSIVSLSHLISLVDDNLNKGRMTINSPKWLTRLRNLSPSGYLSALRKKESTSENPLQSLMYHDVAPIVTAFLKPEDMVTLQNVAKNFYPKAKVTLEKEVKGTTLEAS